MRRQASTKLSAGDAYKQLLAMATESEQIVRRRRKRANTEPVVLSEPNEDVENRDSSILRPKNDEVVCEVKKTLVVQVIVVESWGKRDVPDVRVFWLAVGVFIEQYLTSWARRTQTFSGDIISVEHIDQYFQQLDSSILTRNAKMVLAASRFLSESDLDESNYAEACRFIDKFTTILTPLYDLNVGQTTHYGERFNPDTHALHNCYVINVVHNKM